MISNGVIVCVMLLLIILVFSIFLKLKGSVRLTSIDQQFVDLHKSSAF